MFPVFKALFTFFHLSNNSLTLPTIRFDSTLISDCKLIKKLSMKAVRDFEDESLDFVYLDGNHAFEYITEASDKTSYRNDTLNKFMRLLNTN